jgi:hypothetical protein
MGLPWVRIDANIGHNPKIIALASEGRWRAMSAYLVGIAWSGGQGTAGFIPTSALPFIHATRKDAQQLVDVGLWHSSDIGDGYLINDWDVYQPSAEVGDSYTAKARKGNCIRWHGHACGCWKVSPSDRPANRPAIAIAQSTNERTN